MGSVFACCQQTGPGYGGKFTFSFMYQISISIGLSGTAVHPALGITRYMS